MSRRLPPLYALRAFEAAARHSSFTRAAEELSITQSAVSRHIRTLEEHFACRLFHRSGRHLQLTESARLLLPGIREGFTALERACNTLRAEDDILRMKAPSTLTMRWLLARLSRFRHLQPGNEVQLTSAWMDIDSVDFNDEPFDCAVLLSNGHFPPDWEASYLFPEELIPVGAPNLPSDQPWDAARLANTELLHPTPDRRDWRNWLERMGLADQVSLKGGAGVRYAGTGHDRGRPRLRCVHGGSADGGRGCGAGTLEPAMADGGRQRRALLPGLAENPSRWRAHASAQRFPAK